MRREVSFKELCNIMTHRLLAPHKEAVKEIIRHYLKAKKISLRQCMIEYGYGSIQYDITAVIFLRIKKDFSAYTLIKLHGVSKQGIFKQTIEQWS